MQLTRVFFSQQSRLLLLAAALVFLLTQTINLQHTHAGDLNLHPDCQICLKLGSQGNATLAKAGLPDFHSAAAAFQMVVPQPLFVAAPAPRSRAPPHAA